MKSKFKKVLVDTPIANLKDLEIKCKSTKCDSDLHCFNMSKKAIKKFGKEGVCRDCGENDIDWNRMHRNDIKDIDYIVQSLEKELIRYAYWNSQIDQDAIESAKSRGYGILKKKTRDIIAKKMGHPKDPYDWRQTPYSGKEIINYARHATGTCCRTCLAYWHNIKETETLNDNQIDFCTDLVMHYVEVRIPNVIEQTTM